MRAFDDANMNIIIIASVASIIGLCTLAGVGYVAYELSTNLYNCIIQRRRGVQFRYELLARLVNIANRDKKNRCIDYPYIKVTWSDGVDGQDIVHAIQNKTSSFIVSEYSMTCVRHIQGTRGLSMFNVLIHRDSVITNDMMLLKTMPSDVCAV